MQCDLQSLVQMVRMQQFENEENFSELERVFASQESKYTLLSLFDCMGWVPPPYIVPTAVTILKNDEQSYIKMQRNILWFSSSIASLSECYIIGYYSEVRYNHIYVR